MTRLYHTFLFRWENFIWPFLKKAFLPWLYIRELNKTLEDVINDGAESYEMASTDRDVTLSEIDSLRMAYSAVISVCHHQKLTPSGVIFLNPEYLKFVLDATVGSDAIISTYVNSTPVHILHGLFLLEPTSVVKNDMWVPVPSGSADKVRQSLREYSLGNIPLKDIPYIGSAIEHEEDYQLFEFLTKPVGEVDLANMNQRLLVEFNVPYEDSEVETFFEDDDDLEAFDRFEDDDDDLA